MQLTTLGRRATRATAASLVAGLLGGVVAVLPAALVAGTAAADGTGPIRVTEWAYDGASQGEWFELTNVGAAPVDLTGWRYDDDSANPTIGLDLSAFGVVAAGESVVIAETTPATFRSRWGLCDGVKVIGGNTVNLGRADQINVFSGAAADAPLVDKLAYNDQDGGPRTNVNSAWVQAAGLGANNDTLWTLSSSGDPEGSIAATTGPFGSPGRSKRATVVFNPCVALGGAPTVTPASDVAIGAVGDPTNPTLSISLGDADNPIESLSVTAASANDTVLPDANVVLTGSGASRTVTFTPVARGTAVVTFTVSDPEGRTGTASVTYGASAQAPDPSGRYFHGISDASSAIDVGDGYVVLANDETNTIFLHSTAGSGPAVKTWTFTPAQLGTTDEIDLEAVARRGNTLVWVASHGNSRTGEIREERRTMFATTITGSGATTDLTFLGRYDGLWAQLRDWDHANGHGLGVDALGFVAATAPGVLPNAPDGFNIEGFEFGPDGSGWLGFRGPTVDAAGKELAVIVPVTNILALNAGTPGTTPASFGAPILLDLGGRSIRELRSNAAGEYLISAGPTPAAATWALYTWDGVATHAPELNQLLPDEVNLTGGTWETIVSVPTGLGTGAPVRLVTDSGDTNLYGTGPTKDLPQPFQKSYTQLFTLAPVTHAVSVSVAGTGSGTVVGAGISCPGDCMERVAHGATLQLVASPAAGSRFRGWSGACTNVTGPCTVPAGAAAQVTATFERENLVCRILVPLLGRPLLNFIGLCR